MCLAVQLCIIIMQLRNCFMFLYNKYKWKVFSVQQDTGGMKIVCAFCCHREKLEALKERSERKAWFVLVGNDTLTWCIWGKNELFRWLQKSFGILLFHPPRAVGLYIPFIYYRHGLEMGFPLHVSTHKSRYQMFTYRWMRKVLWIIRYYWRSLSVVQNINAKVWYCLDHQVIRFCVSAQHHWCG